MEIVRLLIRQYIKSYKLFVFWTRRIKLLFVNSGLKIDSTTQIGKNCTFLCTKGSSMRLVNCKIDTGVKLIADHGGHLVIKDTYIGSSSVIVARKEIVIESDCQIAEMVVIRDQNHNYGNKGKTITEQGFTIAPIHIGRNVWIGAKTTILMGVVIGDNAVVGAHAVVNRDVQENTVVAGIPARLIKEL